MQIYDNARQLFGTAQLDWPACNPQLALIGPGYGVQLDLHRTYSDLVDVIASAAIGNPSMSSGFARGDTVNFQDLLLHVDATQCVIWADFGQPTNSPLIVWHRFITPWPQRDQARDYSVRGDALFGGFFRV